MKRLSVLALAMLLWSGAAAPVQASWWDDLWRRIGERRKDPPHISRGGVCLLTPLATGKSPVPVIWRSTPIFVWSGTAVRLRVIDRETKVLMGNQLVRVGRSQVEYAGKPLVPGRVYDWALFEFSRTDVVAGRGSFQMMGAVARQEVDRSVVGLSVEEQVKFWIDRGGVDDAVMVMYGVAQPNAAMVQVQQQWQQRGCE